MIYQNFDLEIISPQGGNRLCARVLESPQGDCPFIEVKWPFDAEEEDQLLAEIYGGLRRFRGRSMQASTIQDFGGRLFEAIFSGDIEHLYRSSLDTSCRSGQGLRVRLRLAEDSELHVRPWEFLFDTESREFLAVRERTPVIRYLPVAQPIPPITVEGPLRILVALSSPTDHPRLDIAREWDILRHALEPSIAAGQLEMRRVPGRCTFDNLRDSLRHFGAHIFHFVGHGIPGALVLEQESGKGLEMEATHLRAAFPSGALPRLIVLNACAGAITQDVPFSGLAQGFLRQGVPAVVAMQASITDDAALIFTRYFYRDLIEIGAVDTSLTEARLRMQANGHPIEWGTPVLYLRALSGQLFKPAAKPGEWSKPGETGTAAAALRLEPGLGERKKKKEGQVKQEAPPPSEPGPGERKKGRTARTRENPPQRQAGTVPGEEKIVFPVPSRETILVPDAKPEPEPGPGPDLAEQERRKKPRPKPDTSLSKAEPPPVGQTGALNVDAIVPAAPRTLAPDTPGPDGPPPVPAGAAALPSTPQPKPVGESLSTKGQARKRTRPEAKGDGQTAVSRLQAGEPAAPPLPSPVQDMAPKLEADQPAPPARLEPLLGKLDIPPLGQASAPPPVRFSLDPPVGGQHVPGESGTPQKPPPLPEEVPLLASPGRRPLVFGVATVLLAIGLMVSTGVDKLLPAPKSTTPPMPAPTAGTVPAVPAGSAAVAGARIRPSSPVRDKVAPPRALAGMGSQARPRSGTRTEAAQARSKPSVRTTGKGQPASERTAPAAADNCNSPVASERSANCLFQTTQENGGGQ